MMQQTDRYGRTIDYLRISITDRCNLRCKYCMPEDVVLLPREEILQYEEILEIARAASEMGIRHIKLTGGEPLVRRDCAELVKGLKRLSGIETVTLTTNGLLLDAAFADLKNAGLDGINISLDTLNEARYEEITGTAALQSVLKAVELCLFGGIKTKINVTVSPFSELADLMQLAELAKDKPLDVRYIELMPIGAAANMPCLDNYLLLRELRQRYPQIERERGKGETGAQSKVHGFGPAVYYHIPGFQGSIGFISSIHDKFCDSCNRLRLSSTGFLKYCLCFEDGIDLKPIIRSRRAPLLMQTELKEAFSQAIDKKPLEHNFSIRDQVREKKLMSSIGG